MQRAALSRAAGISIRTRVCCHLSVVAKRRECCLRHKPISQRSFPMTPLRRRMTEDMQVRNFSPHTQDSYVQQVSLFARHFSKSPEVLGPEEIRSYQVYLTNEKKLAPSSILIAVSALRFLYKVTLHRDWCLQDIIPAPKKPQKLPIVLSPEEVLQFLSCVQSIKHRTILTICYAAGLRISEAIGLKVCDIDSKRTPVKPFGMDGATRLKMCSRARARCSPTMRTIRNSAGS